MTDVLLSAEEAMAAGDARVGGKAMGLAWLALAGVAVPDWRVLPVAAFENHLRRAELSEVARAGIDLPTARRVQEAIRATPLDPAVVEAIHTRVAGRGPVAVRSSVVGEDGQHHSFAGIFDSYLFREGFQEVVDAIKECWASAFSERALAYRVGKDTLPDSFDVGVVLQEMVEGDVSGVMFTSNPMTGAADEVAISACWGLGEGVVGGVCNTDEFTVSHGGVERSVVVADKDIMVVRGADVDTREVPVPADRRRIRCLSAAQVCEMTRQALRIADVFGEPQDIEWTIRGPELVLLQARPVTAAPKADIGNWRTVWDNSNIQESFNGVTLPLTFSWASALYRTVFRETLRMGGASTKTIQQFEPVLRNMIGLVSGRVYYNINNWYRVLQLSPSFDRNKVDVEKMLGVQHPVDFIEDTHLTLTQRFRRLPSTAPVIAGLLWRLSTRRRANRKFQREVAVALAEINERRKFARDIVELLTLADEVLNLCARFAVPIFNDFYLSRQAGKVRRTIARSVDGNADEIVAGLLAAHEAIESIEPTLMLMRIANRIQTSDSWVATLNQGEPREALEALSAASPEVAAELDEFVDRYGDRCIGEQKFETISLRQDRSFLAKVLRNYVADRTLDPSSFERSQRERQRRFETAALVELPALRRWRLRRTLRGARDAIRGRESMRLTRTRVFGLCRAIYTDVGERLSSAGYLDDPRQVFCLTVDEIAAFAEGRAVTTRLADVARMRDAEFAEYALEEPPNQFETFGSPYGGRRVEPFEQSADHRGEDGTLRGTGCCPGVVEGEVRIVLSPFDDLRVVGKILTTVRTDPGWGPLFPGLAGLMVERGSTLSHSAVLARELGIPAVVGIPGLTRTVADGERVRLDGRTGIVQRLFLDAQWQESTNLSLLDRVRPTVCAGLGVAGIAPDGQLLDHGPDSVRDTEQTVKLEPLDDETSRAKEHGKRIVCITGTDGSGKSTQIAALTAAFDARGYSVAHVSIWDAFNAGGVRDRLPFASREAVYRYLKVSTPSSRAYFLFHALQSAIDSAVATDADIVLLDGYWYKYYAMEVAHGGDPVLLRALASGFLEPDATFYLEVAPDLALRRKDRRSDYESGYGDDREFVAFQRRSQAALRELATEFGWCGIDATMPPEAITELILQLLARGGVVATTCPAAERGYSDAAHRSGVAGDIEGRVAGGRGSQCERCEPGSKLTSDLPPSDSAPVTTASRGIS